MPAKHRFTIGNIVYLKTGHAPQEVMETRIHYGEPQIRCRYSRWFSGGYEEHLRSWRRESDFLLYLGDPALHDYDQKKATPMKKLYEHNHTGRLGTFIGYHSNGEMILEMTDNKAIATVPVSEVKEVRPYTIAARGTMNNTTYTFRCVKGAVELDDLILLDNGVLIRITALDTQVANAAIDLKGHKLLTEKIEPA